MTPELWATDPVHRLLEWADANTSTVSFTKNPHGGWLIILGPPDQRGSMTFGPSSTEIATAANGTYRMLHERSAV